MIPDINFEWAQIELQKFVSLTDRVSYASPSIVGTQTRGSDIDIAAQAHIVEQIFARVLPTWRTDIPVSKDWKQHRQAAARSIAVIERHEEIAKNLGSDAPQISAADLHPWVWSGAASLWASGHFRSAVEDAAKKVNAETQNKVGRRDVSETDLFKQSFSLDPAKAGKPRLRRIPNDGSNTYKSMQRGVMAMAEGIFAGIRNPFGHSEPLEIERQVALEYLAALSVLARWVDEAKLEVEQ